MKFVFAVVLVFALSGCVSESIAPSQLQDRDVEPFKQCYDKAAKIGRPVLPGTPGKAAAVFRKATQYPTSEIQKETSACILVLYDITEKGQADNIRIMEASDGSLAFATEAVNALLASEFEKKAVKNVGMLVTFKAKQGMKDTASHIANAARTVHVQDNL